VRRAYVDTFGLRWRSPLWMCYFWGSVGIHLAAMVALAQWLIWIR
jgi:hypothetical protein